MGRIKTRIVFMRYQNSAAFLIICGLLTPSANAGLMSWIRKQLPYQLPPKKMNYTQHVPSSTRLYLDRYGRPLVYENTSRTQFFTPLENIATNLKKFVVLSEDAKFYTHKGIDFKEIKNSISDNIHTGKRIRGASTITQQVVKNLFLDKKKSYIRKLFEVPWAKKVENDFSKKQILELYLNIIEWGPGIYGAEAAARHYFDTRARDLQDCQALYLTMIIPNPKRFDAFLGEKKQNFILKKMKTFSQRIYSEQKISNAQNELHKECSIELRKTNREHPIQHTGSYLPNKSPIEKKLAKALSQHFSQKTPSSTRVLTSLDKDTPLEEIQIERLNFEILKQEIIEKAPLNDPPNINEQLPEETGERKDDYVL